MNSRAVVGGVQQANQPLSCDKFRGDNPPDLFHSFIKLKINDTLKILVSLQFLKVEFIAFPLFVREVVMLDFNPWDAISLIANFSARKLRVHNSENIK